MKRRLTKAEAEKRHIRVVRSLLGYAGITATDEQVRVYLAARTLAKTVLEEARRDAGAIETEGRTAA